MWPEEGDFPENVHRVLYVVINKHSFRSFSVFGSLFGSPSSFVPGRCLEDVSGILGETVFAQFVKSSSTNASLKQAALSG